MSISELFAGNAPRDNKLLQELIMKGLDRAEIREALSEIGLSERELLREINSKLGPNYDDILASAESERQEVQRIENDALTRTASIDAENRTNLRLLWLKYWKRDIILGVCILAVLSLLEVHIAAYSMVHIGLIAFGALLLIYLAGPIVRDRHRLKRDRLRQHQELADELAVAQQSYRAALLDRGVLPFIRQVMNDPSIQKEYYGVYFNVRKAPGLQGDDLDFRVDTAGSKRLMEKLDGIPGGGNFGIAGPRGSGKTSVLTAICDGRLAIHQGQGTPSGSPFRVLVSAPVEFSSREFLLHLFSVMCRTYIWEFTKLTTGPELPTVESRFRGPVRRRSGTLSVLFFVSSLIVLAFAVPARLWRQYWQEHAVPRLAKLYGKNWDEAKKDAAKVTLFVGKLDTRAIVVGLILLTISFVFLGMLLRRLIAHAFALRENTLRAGQLGWHAREMLQRIKFQQSYSSGWSGTLKLPIVEGGLNGAKNMAENQMSLPDIVASIKGFLRRVARERRVIVAIDELDKVDSDVKAGQFLNDLKGIFYVPNCFYLVSVSEEALSNFELRGLPFRDAFDSAFDEVAHFRYLAYSESRLLLERRVIGLPAAYLCLCHCTAGGLPRDLIRVARELMLLRRRHIGDDDSDNLLANSATLAKITSDLVRADLEDRIAATVIALHRASGLQIDELAAWIDDVRTRMMSDETVVAENLLALCASYPALMGSDAGPSQLEEEELKVRRLGFGLVGSLYYSATLLELFTDNLCEAEIRRIEGSGDGSAEQLALARQAFATSAMLAWPRISSFRETWNMEILDSPIRKSTSKPKQLRPRGQGRRPRSSIASLPIVPSQTRDSSDDDGTPFIGEADREN
jgi:hypothetical protein